MAGRGMGDRWAITAGEAAERLGISRTSACQCTTLGETPTVRLGRRVLVPLAGLVAMLDADPPPDEGEAAHGTDERYGRARAVADT